MAKLNANEVLILVLVEDTLRVLEQILASHSPRSLNPCSSGRYSASNKASALLGWTEPGLNPCSSGRYSARYQ